MNEHHRLALARDTIRGRRPIDLELPNLHELSLAAADAARMRADRLVRIIQSQGSPIRSLAPTDD